MAEYLAHQAQKLSIATLDRRLASLSKVHRILGFPSPTSTELVRATFQGIRWRASRQAKPVTVELLRRIVGSMGSDLRSVRDGAMLLIAFAGALRRSELGALEYADVDRTSEGLLIRIRRSKTDQEGQGRFVEIPPARGLLCPVVAMERWLDVSGIKDGGIFRRIDRQQRLGVGLITGEAVALMLRCRTAQDRRQELEAG